MEALAALSVAAATVQFVDFGLETLKLCRQIRQNEKGATEANAQIEQAITELQEIQKLFKPAVTYQGVAPQDIQIIAKARKECDEAANELLQLL
jgi:ATP-dependent exoDNAse (exonuclease V) beta subunit